MALVAEVLVREIGHPHWCDYAAKVTEGCTRDFGCDIWRQADRWAEAVVAAQGDEVDRLTRERDRALARARASHRLVVELSKSAPSAAPGDPDGPREAADRSQGPSRPSEGVTSAPEPTDWTYDSPAVQPRPDGGPIG